MRAEGGVQAVDVEADVDGLRQLGDDARALLRPGLAGKARLGQLRVEEGDDLSARAASSSQRSRIPTCTSFAMRVPSTTLSMIDACECSNPS
jgi:hypothetical protein